MQWKPSASLLLIPIIYLDKQYKRAEVFCSFRFPNASEREKSKKARSLKREAKGKSVMEQAIRKTNQPKR